MTVFVGLILTLLVSILHIYQN